MIDGGGRNLALAIIAALKAEGDPVRAAGEKKYLKSSLYHLGVKVPVIRKITIDFSRGGPELARENLLETAQTLSSSDIHEGRVAAVELLRANSKLLGESDFPFLETFLREAKTWALSDGLSTGVCAQLAERVEGAGKVLDRWSQDPDFWLRRAALLTLLPPLRRGGGEFERFGRYADGMLEEKEFFIRKAIGWVLRDTGRKRPQMVSNWLAPRVKRASGLTVREALKHLPEETRIELRKLKGN